MFPEIKSVFVVNRFERQVSTDVHEHHTVMGKQCPVLAALISRTPVSRIQFVEIKK